MGINGISGSGSTLAALTPTKPEAAPPPASTTAAATKPVATQPAHDTVKLTGTALAKSLKLSGQNPAQIAQKMGIDVKTVDKYLGITEIATTTTTPTPATAAPPANKVATDSPATPKAYSPAEEVSEPAAEKAAETLQGKK